MTHKRARIGVVDPDGQTAEMVAEHLSRALAVDVVCSKTASDAIDHDRKQRYDLVLADLSLADSDALQFARQIQAYGERPIILTSENPTLGRAVEAMRLGVKDLLTKPFDLSHLTQVTRRALDQHEQQAREKLRIRRLGQNCRDLERDRRELSERIELVCRDLVSAYGRLAERVVASQSTSE